MFMITSNFNFKHMLTCHAMYLCTILDTAYIFLIYFLAKNLSLLRCLGCPLKEPSTIVFN